MSRRSRHGEYLHLERSQQDDGGWALTWDPPSRAAVSEWRGIVTLQALRVLAAYGRIEPPPHRS